MSSSKKYPEQIGTYKIVPKKIHGSNWQEFDTLRLLISVGLEYHEGEKFQDTINWALPRFKNIIVLVNDTLQRHNLIFQHNQDVSEATYQTRLEGKKWRFRNSMALKNIPDENIIHWDNWLDHPDYQEAIIKSYEMYNSIPDFKSAVDTNVKEAWQRRFERGDPNFTLENKNEFFRRSRIYTLEETAALSIAYREYKGISGYPATFLKTWSIFVDNEIPNAPKGLENAHCIKLAIKRRVKSDDISEDRIAA